jgi:His/Glu/Gln/Arg/opine family amino acid ABC transporter permease subunit
MIKYIPLLLQGISVTILAWLVTAICSLIIGLLLGILSCNKISSKTSFAIIKVYTFISKGIPAYVQILIAYFLIPSLIGINIPGFIAACGALAFCSSGYLTEIVRSGINSVAQGQWDACQALGYPISKTLKRIILPQAFKNILPALFGEFEQLLKSTSLLATIGIAELTRTGMNIISRELNPVSVYLTIACIYLLLSAIINLIVIYSERRLQYGQR